MNTAAKATKSVDTYGNVFYAVTLNGQSIGQVDKTCSGYQATLANGSYIPARSLKLAIELLARAA